VFFLLFACLFFELCSSLSVVMMSLLLFVEIPSNLSGLIRFVNAQWIDENELFLVGLNLLLLHELLLFLGFFSLDAEVLLVLPGCFLEEIDQCFLATKRGAQSPASLDAVLEERLENMLIYGV
jgi:hypothetical protein